MDIKVERVAKSSKKVLDALNALIPQMSPNSKEVTPDNLERIVANKNIHLIILKSNTGSIVACATLALVPTPSNLLGFVEDVVVDKEFRGKGYGRIIMQEIITIAKNSNVNQIKLQSNPKRVNANILYKKLGFIMFDTNSYCYNIS